MATVPENLEPKNLEIADELIAERRHLHDLPHDMAKWMRRTIITIDTISLWSGRIFCLLLLPAMGAMVYEVVARKLFIAPTFWAYDISRMTIGAMFMLGAGYALMRGVHIRADFLYRTWPVRMQALMDLVLYFTLFFPGLLLFFYITSEYALSAWLIWERTMDTAWMAPLAPARSAMPIGAMLLIMQGVSECCKCIYAFKHKQWP